MSEDHIRELVTLYYSWVRKSLSALVHIRIQVVGLGQFQIKHWVVEKETDKVADYETQHVHQIRDNKKLQHTRLLTIQDMLRERENKKREKRKLKDEYYKQKEGQQATEAQELVDTPEGDSTGLVELSDRQQESQTDGRQENRDMQD